MARTYYTLDEARELLPNVKKRAASMVQIHAHLRTITEAFFDEGIQLTQAVLEGLRETTVPDDLAPRFYHAQALYAAMMGEVSALKKLGAEVKSLDNGLLDFWSWLDGEQEVALCWKLGEADIDYYHTSYEGFAGRQKIESQDFRREKKATAPQRTAEP